MRDLTQAEYAEEDLRLVAQNQEADARLQAAYAEHIEPLKEEKRAIERERSKLLALRDISKMPEPQRELLAEVLAAGKENG